MGNPLNAGVATAPAMTPRACFRSLRHYKYQLVENYGMHISIKPQQDIETEFIALDRAGRLTIKERYAWDGPSGPSIDTLSFMRGSLVHDALYQVMRLGQLDHKTERARADQILEEICLEDGMSKFRAWYVRKSVEIFGEKAARPTPHEPDPVTCVSAPE